MTAMRGKRARPTSLHQTRTSTSCVMSDPSSFLPITALLWITGIAFPALFCHLPISVVICHLKLTHGLRRRYDPAQQTTTIRRLTKFQCDLNTRKERSLLVVLEKAWRCLQILLKPSESMNCSLRLLSRCIFYNRTGSGRTHR